MPLAEALSVHIVLNEIEAIAIPGSRFGRSHCCIQQTSPPTGYYPRSKASFVASLIMMFDDHGRWSGQRTGSLDSAGFAYWSTLLAHAHRRPCMNARIEL